MFYRFGRALIKLLNLILYNIHVEGEENIPETGGVVLCPNHISNYDPLAVATHMTVSYTHLDVYKRQGKDC